MITFNFNKEEAKYLYDYFLKLKKENKIEYDIWAKIHDQFTLFEFEEWKRKKGEKNE